MGIVWSHVVSLRIHNLVVGLQNNVNNSSYSTDLKPSSITPERILMLDNLNFAWNAQEAAWTKHVTDLKSFINDNHHCNVPLNCPKYPKLGLWVKEQRRHYTLMKQGKPSHMTQARVDELTNLGFRWDTHEATFLTRLRELEQYKERYGTCLVPTTYPKLGTWCHHQRRQYKKWKAGRDCHITQERIDLLTNIGFIWNPRGDSSSKSRRTVQQYHCLVHHLFQVFQILNRKNKMMTMILINHHERDKRLCKFH